MKINPVGVQAYQQLSQRPARAEEAADRSIIQSGKGATVKDISITPQVDATSALSVAGPKGNYGDFLTEKEQKALKMLFEKYDYSSRVGQSAGSEDRADALGRVVDVKV
ncbi:MAG: hypothetical protein V3T31_07470 [candidate division Zixibacteria bacterium]